MATGRPDSVASGRARRAARGYRRRRPAAGVPAYCSPGGQPQWRWVTWRIPRAARRWCAVAAATPRCRRTRRRRRAVGFCSTNNNVAAAAGAERGRPSPSTGGGRDGFRDDTNVPFPHPILRTSSSNGRHRPQWRFYPSSSITVVGQRRRGPQWRPAATVWHPHYHRRNGRGGSHRNGRPRVDWRPREQPRHCYRRSCVDRRRGGRGGCRGAPAFRPGAARGAGCCRLPTAVAGAVGGRGGRNGRRGDTRGWD